MTKRLILFILLLPTFAFSHGLDEKVLRFMLGERDKQTGESRPALASEAFVQLTACSKNSDQRELVSKLRRMTGKKKALFEITVARAVENSDGVLLQELIFRDKAANLEGFLKALDDPGPHLKDLIIGISSWDAEMGSAVGPSISIRAERCAWLVINGIEGRIEFVGLSPGELQGIVSNTFLDRPVVLPKLGKIEYEYRIPREEEDLWSRFLRLFRHRELAVQ